MDSVQIAIAAGLSLGVVIGYRVGRAVFRTVGGPFAGKPLTVGFVVAGSVFFLVPASIFAVLGVRDLVAGGAVSADSPATLAGIVAGIALVIASGLVVAVFASALCGRFIEEVRSGRRRPDDTDF